MQQLLLNENIITNFQEKVDKYSSKIALVYKEHEYTYQELDELSNIVANNLMKYRLTRQNKVAIYMDKSDKYIIAILSILKLGSIYIPIDNAYPIRRINNMISKADANTLIYSYKDKETIDELNINNKISIEELLINNNGQISELHSSILSTDLAYIIFTSGSTGEPKGMGIRHEGVLNLINSMEEVVTTNYRVNNVGMLAPMVFDMSVAQMYLALLTGRKLIVIPEAIKRDPQLLVNYMVDHKIEICDITPQHLRILVKYVNSLESSILLPNIMVSSGEKITNELVQKYFELSCSTNTGILNSYGPSEVCVYASFNMITKNNFDINQDITIGKAIHNTDIYLINENGELCNSDEIGEICISGIGLTTGYIKDKFLTETYFMDNPYNKGTRMYKTKDSGKLGNNDEIICLGRMDNQIKHKGYRIELEEIEKILNKYENIEQSKVVLNKDTDELIAHYQSFEQQNTNSIILHLKELVPAYMIPNRYIWHKNFSLNINGKIDQSQLIVNSSNVSLNSIKVDKDIQEIINILTNLLTVYIKKDDINIYDDLIEIGADSLTIMNLCIDLYTHWKLEVEFFELYQCKNLHEIAKLIQNRINNSTDSLIKKNLAHYDNKPVVALEFQKLLLKLEKRENHKRDRLKLHKYPTYNIVYEITVNGRFELSKLKNALFKVVNSHTAFRSFFVTIENEVYMERVKDIENYFKVIHIEEKLSTKYIKRFLCDFDISKPPLFNFIVFETNIEQKIMINIHHTIFDFYSLTIFIKQLLDIYFYDKVLEVSDFSISITNNRNNKRDEHINYWKNYLKKRSIPARFPSDKGVNDYKIDKNDEFVTYVHCINGKLFYNIKQFCRKLRVSEYTFYIGILNLLVNKYSKNDDIIIGTYIPGRTNDEMHTIGFFTKLVCIREKIDLDISVREFINILNKNIKNVIENYSLQYLDLYKLLEFDELIKGELFSIIFNYVYQLTMKEQDIEIVVDEIGEEPNELPFSIKFFQQEQQILIKITYATRIYSTNYIVDIANFIEQYSADIILNDGNIKIGELLSINSEDISSS